MRLIAIMPARSESWIIGASARALLMWVDHLVICEHQSIDNTLQICQEVSAENPGRVTVLRWPDEQWTEMRHRQCLLESARVLGATHIALVDADEILSGNLLHQIRGYVEATPDGKIMQLPWLCPRNGIDQVIVSGAWSKADVSTAFKDGPSYHWKTQPGGYDHHYRHPMGLAAELKPHHRYHPVTDRSGGLIHMQFASRRRLIAKHALYKMNELLRWPDRKTASHVDQMYSNTVIESDNARTSPVPGNWWGGYPNLTKYIDINREPWQEAEVKRLISLHGRDRFIGLNLFCIDS